LSTVRSLPMLHAMQPLVAAGAGVVAVATVAGAWLARWRLGRQDLWFGAAAGALLVIAGFHLLPDAWADARSAHLWVWAVPAVAVAAFLLASVVARFGCTCAADKEHASGAGTAGVLAVHRFLEGSALALTASLTVAVALAVHALGEGLAVGALLTGYSGRRLAAWLAVMCIGPVVGAAVTSAYHLPQAAGPLLVAVAAGILAQAARVSLLAAFDHLRPRAFLLSRPAAAVAVAAVVTALAVHATG
jgi:zinc transporter ZupT